MFFNKSYIVLKDSVEFRKTVNGTIILDNNGKIYGLSKDVFILSSDYKEENDLDDLYIEINRGGTDLSFIFDWQICNNPIGSSREMLIELLITEYFNNVSSAAEVTFPSSINVVSVAQPSQQLERDAFGRLKISQPYTLFDSKLVKDSNSLFWDDVQVSGTGTTSIYQDNKSSMKLSVSASTAGKRVRQSKIRGNYQPGKSQFIYLTALVGLSPNGISKKWGNFDNRNGLFFDTTNGVFGVNVRTFTSGATVDNKINQSNFNGDKLDGTGWSGYTLDLTKSMIYFIDFEWLAVGQVRFGIVDKGRYIVCHTVYNSQTLTTTDVIYMTNPNLPIRYEIENTGSGIASDMYAICSTIMSEGGQENTAIQTYISRNGTSITLATQDLYTPVISIRLKSLANSGTVADINGLCTRVNISDIDLLITSISNYEWRIILNPTIAGTDAASWINITNSSLQYDVSRTLTNTISGGFVIAGGYGASTNTVKISIDNTINTYLTLGSNINETTDQLVLVVANISGNGGTAYGGITVSEYC